MGPTGSTGSTSSAKTTAARATTTGSTGAAPESVWTARSTGQHAAHPFLHALRSAHAGAAKSGSAEAATESRIERRLGLPRLQSAAQTAGDEKCLVGGIVRDGRPGGHGQIAG